ncbi:MAG: 2-dehydro-3-deoxyphosphooctonate aldolase [Rhodobacteraceae bacterium]|nr:2-dehydro-3-deoxyphosphooctonate aldolase [Paracoccaceae bacterium]
MDSSPLMTAQDSLVAIMIAGGASDENMSNRELVSISRIVDHLPVFKNYEPSKIKLIAEMVFDLFEEEDGLDALFGLVREALPEKLYETAYALACDVAASDGTLPEVQLRFLEEIRHELNIDRLHGAAIERGARARHMVLD